MTGSGSGGGFGSGGSGGVVDCAEFSFETHIHSPDPREVGRLTVGMTLKVKQANFCHFRNVHSIADQPRIICSIKC